MRAIANNNPLGDVVAEQVEAFLSNGKQIQLIPLGVGSETPVTCDNERRKTEFENRMAIKKSNGDFFTPGVFNPNSAASKKAYSRGGKA